MNANTPNYPIARIFRVKNRNLKSQHLSSSKTPLRVTNANEITVLMLTELRQGLKER
jgi:hypothetical protein